MTKDQQALNERIERWLENKCGCYQSGDYLYKDSCPTHRNGGLPRDFTGDDSLVGVMLNALVAKGYDIDLQLRPSFKRLRYRVLDTFWWEYGVRMATIAQAVAIALGKLIDQEKETVK